MHLILLLALTVTPAAPYQWEPSRVDPAIMRLWDGAGGVWHLAGEYDPATDTYRVYSGHHGRCIYVPNAEPPVAPPSRNFGVSPGPGTSLTEPRAVIAGRLVEMGAVHDAIDRQSMPWLVACGGTAAQRTETLGKIPQDLQARYRVASQDADHWTMRPGFRPGKPVALYVLAPDGAERHRQEDGDVAALVNALREPDPNYDPNKSPDLRKGNGWPSLSLNMPSRKSATSAALVGALAVAGSTFIPRRKTNAG